MTVLVINETNVRIIHRGTLEQCQRVAGDYLRETFILPTRY